MELKPQIDKFEKLCKFLYEVAKVAPKSEDATKALHETLQEFNSITWLIVYIYAHNKKVILKPQWDKTKMSPNLVLMELSKEMEEKNPKHTKSFLENNQN